MAGEVHEPTVWLSVAGFLVSLASFGVSGAALWRTHRVKRLDLRIELRKLSTSLHDDVAGLPAKLELAKRSREAISAARGMFQSGAMKKWSDGYADDLQEVNELPGKLPPADEAFGDANERALEEKLIALTTVQRRVAALAAKYDSGLEDDRRQRELLIKAQATSPVRSPFPFPRE